MIANMQYLHLQCVQYKTHRAADWGVKVAAFYV